jgi:hypothetical protein
MRGNFYDTYNLNTYGVMNGEYLRGSEVSDKVYKTVNTSSFTGQIEGDFSLAKSTGRAGTQMDFYIKNKKSDTSVPGGRRSWYILQIL